jgi:hypothetical protein
MVAANEAGLRVVDKAQAVENFNVHSELDSEIQQIHRGKKHSESEHHLNLKNRHHIHRPHYKPNAQHLKHGQAYYRHELRRQGHRVTTESRMTSRTTRTRLVLVCYCLAKSLMITCTRLGCVPRLSQRPLGEKKPVK